MGPIPPGQLNQFRNAVFAPIAAEYPFGRTKTEPSEVGQMLHLLAALVAGAGRRALRGCIRRVGHLLKLAGLRFASLEHFRTLLESKSRQFGSYAENAPRALGRMSS